MSQLTFLWPPHTSYATEDFIVSPSNKEAVDFLASWPNKNSLTALLTGPSASGKTHLVQAWISRVQAHKIDKTQLGRIPSEALWQGHPIATCEDIESITDESALFHLLRHAETQALSLLLSSSIPASQLHFTLPDLHSRLLAMPCVQLSAPDEAMLHAFLVKSFSDRQMRISEEVIVYMLRRMPRSFIAARILVDNIEQNSFRTKKDITIPVIKSLIELDMNLDE